MSKPKVRTAVMRPLPSLDVDEFNALTDLLFEALNGNSSACANILGISRPTWKRWEKTPPDWPWWNIVLRHAIKHTLTGMVGRRRSPAAKHRQYIRDALARVKNSGELIEAIETGAYELSAAETYLRRLLFKGPQPWHKIRVGSNYSPRVLQAAAKSLGVVKEQMGYGDGKISIWSLPATEE